MAGPSGLTFGSSGNVQQTSTTTVVDCQRTTNNAGMLLASPIPQYDPINGNPTQEISETTKLLG
jgi:hypothetical protein